MKAGTHHAVQDDIRRFQEGLQLLEILILLGQVEFTSGLFEALQERITGRLALDEVGARRPALFSHTCQGNQRIAAVVARPHQPEYLGIFLAIALGVRKP